MFKQWVAQVHESVSRSRTEANQLSGAVGLPIPGLCGSLQFNAPNHSGT